MAVSWFPYTISGSVTYVSDSDTFHLVNEDWKKTRVEWTVLLVRHPLKH